jgi:hypothetical protein
MVAKETCLRKAIVLLAGSTAVTCRSYGRRWQQYSQWRTAVTYITAMARLLLLELLILLVVLVQSVDKRCLLACVLCGVHVSQMLTARLLSDLVLFSKRQCLRRCAVWFVRVGILTAGGCQLTCVLLFVLRCCSVQEDPTSRRGCYMDWLCQHSCRRFLRGNMVRATSWPACLFCSCFLSSASTACY